MHGLASSLPLRAAAAPSLRRPAASRLPPARAAPGDALDPALFEALGAELQARSAGLQERTEAALKELGASPNPEAFLGTLTRGEAELRHELGELQAAVLERAAAGRRGAEPVAAAAAAPATAAAEDVPQAKLLTNAVDELRAEIVTTRRVLGL